MLSLINLNYIFKLYIFIEELILFECLLLISSNLLGSLLEGTKKSSFIAYKKGFRSYTRYAYLFHLCAGSSVHQYRYKIGIYYFYHLYFNYSSVRFLSNEYFYNLMAYICFVTHTYPIYFLKL